MSSNLARMFQSQDSTDATHLPALAARIECRPADESSVKIGFVSPAESLAHSSLNLGDYLVRHPLATFFVRVSDDAMAGAKLSAGALLVVDRAETAHQGNLILAVVNGEFCVRSLELSTGTVRLCAAHPDYPDIQLTPEDKWEIWGRVMYSINQH